MACIELGQIEQGTQVKGRLSANTNVLLSAAGVVFDFESSNLM